MERNDGFPLAAFAVMVLLGGANSVAVRFSNSELAPFWGATLRFAAASIILFAIAFATRLPLPRGRALVGAGVYGLLGFAITYACFYWSLVFLPASILQILLALVPLLTFLLAILHGLERFETRGLVGGLLGLAGVAVVFWRGTTGTLPFAALIVTLVGAVAASEAGIAVKRFPRTHPVVGNALGMGVGAAILAGLSLVFGEPWMLPARAATWGAIAFLVFVGSITVFGLYLYVLGRWSASATAYQFVLLPFVTVGIASVLAGERVTLAFWFGAALVLAGVYIGALRGRAPSKPFMLTRSFRRA